MSASQQVEQGFKDQFRLRPDHQAEFWIIWIAAVIILSFLIKRKGP